MRLLIILVVTLGMAGQAAANQPVSGVVAVSTGPMKAFSQAIGRDLSAGDDVYLNDEVETGKKTRAQVLLRDESVFSLAPSSKVVFDAFVFDPLAEEGVLEASLIKGGMRFVSGQLAKNTPENIKIKAGSATVGIRGTEIMATQGDTGSTFVLLSGAMEIQTAAGIQLINRSGFGIDVSPEGMLGAVREVPLAEINAILAPPPEAADADDEGNSDSAGEDDSESESAEAGSSESDTESAEEGESSFDSAVASAADDSGDADDGGVGLSDMTPAAEAAAAPPPVSASEVASSIVDSLAEDSQATVAEALVASDIGLTLSQSKIAANPYFSSTGKVLIRGNSNFETVGSNYGITRDLLRETFPDGGDVDLTAVDGFDHTTDVNSGGINLDNYDAVLLYMDDANDLSADEQAMLRAFIHTDGKRVVVIGEQHVSMQTPINSALKIFDTDTQGEFRYSAANASGVSEANYNALHFATLTPNNSSNSPLLDGVEAFVGSYDGDSGFPYLSFTRSIIGTNIAPGPVNNDILSISGDGQALDFGTKGALFISRFSCSSDNSVDAHLGASVSSNFVSDGRTQFCRNLFSSLAPNDSLADVEVGTLAATGADGQASFTLTSFTDLFKIVGDKLLLKGGAVLDANNYNLAINTQLADGTTAQSAVQVSVTDGAAQARIVSTRETVTISNGSVGSNNSSVTINGTNLQTDLNDISWISVGLPNTPGQTGLLTLHYKETAGGETFDRFHEIEVNYDCASAYCDDFATSMDTQNDMIFGQHFNADNFGDWSSFFTRFTTGTGTFRHAYNFSSSNGYNEGGSSDPYLDTLNADYSHALSVNYGSRSGVLRTAGTFDGIVDANGNAANFDVSWAIDFLGNGSACSGTSCHLQVGSANNASVLYNLRQGELEAGSGVSAGVYLANMPLPNGKYGMAVKSYLGAEHASGCDASSQC
ncbi:MAG: FecR family protein, partial [Alphaproteobacteria bacterium]|nr:FecR family protein [Alphaproteobacteria bacterium]